MTGFSIRTVIVIGERAQNGSVFTESYIRLVTV